MFDTPFSLLPPHANEQGEVIDVGVHIYIYVCGQTKTLNRTIDSPFQNSW